MKNIRGKQQGWNPKGQERLGAKEVLAQVTERGVRGGGENLGELGHREREKQRASAAGQSKR